MIKKPSHPTVPLSERHAETLEVQGVPGPERVRGPLLLQARLL
jgi:hypothetical protein